MSQLLTISEHLRELATCKECGITIVVHPVIHSLISSVCVEYATLPRAAKMIYDLYFFGCNVPADAALSYELF